MTTRSAVLVAVAATATVVVAFCAWFLRPVSDADRLETFPRALAAAACERRFDDVAGFLAPEFVLKDGGATRTRDEALLLLRELVGTRRFAPTVAHVVPVRFDGDKHNLIVYGVLIEGDPAVERAPKTRSFRLEALVDRREGRFVVLEAGL